MSGNAEAKPCASHVAWEKVLSMLVACLFALGILPQSLSAEPQQGQRLRDALIELNEQGATLVFSSELVDAEMLVLNSPKPADPVETARLLLAPHGLTLVPGPGGRWLVTRDNAANTPRPDLDADSRPPPANERMAAIDELLVVASRYRLYGSGPGAQFDNEEIDQLPHLADDVMRAISRLPAAVADDFSAHINLRGGTPEETAVYLDGLPLIDPFHLKDLNGALSIVDSNLVDRVDLLPGGYPSAYGDSTSGIVNIQTLPVPEQSVHSLGVSFINAFANTRGRFKDGRGGWMLSLRRGYLDWLFKLIDTGEGEFSPRYLDVLGKLEHDLGDRHAAALQVLAARDDLTYLDDTEGTRVAGVADSLFLWGRITSQWSDSISSEAVLWSSSIDRRRDVGVDDADDISADVLDDRDIHILGLRSDWRFRAGENWQIGAGFELTDNRVDYDYSLTGVTNAPEYPTAPPIDRRSLLRVGGETIGAYVSVRRDVGRLAAELGYRWDAERYTGRDELLSSPRLNLQYRMSTEARLYLAWGDYNQYQPAESLQVEDGVEQFFPAKRAEHRVLGIEHNFDSGLSVRADAYQKRYRKLRPRYTNLFDSYEPIPEANPDRYRVGADSGEARGVELTVRRRADAGFSWWGSYTWSAAEDRIDGADVPREWDQPHAVNLVANWQGARWNLNLAAAWHTGWPRTDALLGTVDTPGGPQDAVVAGERNANRFPDYLRVDARISRTVSLQDGAFVYFFEIYNLFDTDNACCIDEVDIVSGPALLINEESWLPRMPSFGFTWTFH